MGSKACTKCSLVKSLEDFDRDKGYASGRKAYCISCRKAYAARSRASNMRKNSSEASVTSKRCSACLENLPAAMFPRNRSSTTGLFCMCKSCASIKAKLTREQDPEKQRRYQRASALSVRARHEQGGLTKVVTKLCRNCDRVCDAESFYPDNDRVSGLSTYCKACEKTLWANRKKTMVSTNPAYATQQRIASRIRASLKSANASKTARTMVLLGCSPAAFRKHIEQHFVQGMSWDNYGRSSGKTPYWEVDHILPCKMFALSDCQEQHRCFHYTNQQPLWRCDNQQKSGHVSVYDDILSSLYRLFDPMLDMW